MAKVLENPSPHDVQRGWSNCRWWTFFERALELEIMSQDNLGSLLPHLRTMDFDEDDEGEPILTHRAYRESRHLAFPWFVKVPHNQLAHHIITFVYAWMRRYSSNWWIFRWKWHENTLCVYWETKLTLLCETLCFIHQCLSGNYLACFTSFFPEILM